MRRGRLRFSCGDIRMATVDEKRQRRVSTVTAMRKETKVSLPLAETPKASRSLLRKLKSSIAVWLLYVPHLTFVYWLGPRWGMVWVRWIARVHWLFTFVGFQCRARQSIREVLPSLDCELSANQILRRHFEFKHACFIELRLYAFSRWRKSEWALRWSSLPEGDARFNELAAEGKGLIAAGYHFGYYRLGAHMAGKTYPRLNFCQVLYGTSPHAALALPSFSRLAGRLTRFNECEATSSVYHLTPGVPPFELLERLSEGEVLLLAVDGLFSTDYVDVPFLDGKMRMSCGWARLAGITGSPVTVLTDESVGHRERQIRLAKCVRCNSKSDDDVHRAVAEVAKVLESYVRQKPWEWHPWHRLRIESDEEGKSLYILDPAEHVPEFAANPH